MSYVLTGYEPEAVFRYFEEICRIPRPSYREEKIADYLEDFAKQRHLEYTRDRWNNLLIRLPATPGHELRAPILLQGHTDMVCEKNADVVHDFLTDPIRLQVKGEWLFAKGTTLGGDDGIAVAMMLAILDGAVPVHPAVECLFTVSEEVGMDGAQNFDYSAVTARTMVNLDSEKLGIVTAGCAGGCRSEITLSTADAIPFEGVALRVFLSGLAGGHSGEDIHRGRANANKLMGRILALYREEDHDFSLVSLAGGSKDNAIPRECEAVIAVANAEAANAALTELGAALAEELVPDDRNFYLTVEETENADLMFSQKTTEAALTLLACPANGVFEMSRDVEGLVEYSRNLGVIVTEPEALTFVFSTRSSIEARIDASLAELNAFACICGAISRHFARYPGWHYAEHSEVRKAYLEAYSEVCGEAAKINVVHAGLECAVIYGKIPGMDMISVGPTLKNIHSPDEGMNLASVATFWKTLVRLLEKYA